MRIKLSLTCSRCGSRNYRTTRLRREGAQPLKLKKFCNKCHAHTVHVEAK